MIFFFSGAAEDVVDVPDEFDVRLVGVGAAEAEIGAVHVRGRALGDHVGERDRGLGAVADIGVVIGEFAGLGGDGVGDLGAAVADIDAVEPGEGVEQAGAVAVLDMDAGRAGDHAVGALAPGVLAVMGGGVQERGAVPLIEAVVAKHCASPEVRDLRDPIRTRAWPKATSRRFRPPHAARGVHIGE